jgi:hypothetical protein
MSYRDTSTTSTDEWRRGPLPARSGELAGGEREGGRRGGRSRFSMGNMKSLILRNIIDYNATMPAVKV